MIILASQSPRRQELLKLTGLPFTIRIKAKNITNGTKKATLYFQKNGFLYDC